MSGNGKNDLAATVIGLGVIIAVFTGGWFILETGIGESWDVITGDTANVSADTNATFGGSVGMDDRLAMVGAYLWVLGPSGLAIVSTGKENPPAIRKLVKWAPIIVGAVVIMSFSGTALDVVQGEFDFDTATDTAASFALFTAGALTAGIGAAMGIKGKD